MKCASLCLNLSRQNFVNVNCNWSQAISLSAFNFCSCINTSSLGNFFLIFYVVFHHWKFAIVFNSHINILIYIELVVFFCKAQAFLDSLSLNTIGLVVPGTIVGTLFSYAFFPPTKCSEQIQWPEAGLVFSAYYKQPLFSKHKLFWNNRKRQILVNFEIIIEKRYKHVKPPLFCLVVVIVDVGCSTSSFRSWFTSITKVACPCNYCN